jgi:hypothetical protein
MSKHVWDEIVLLVVKDIVDSKLQNLRSAELGEKVL